VLCVLPRERQHDLSELLEAYRARGFEPQVEHYRSSPPDLAALVSQVPLAAAMLARAASFAPRTMLPGAWLEGPTGRVPTAWLPIHSKLGLKRFAATAARVQRRERQVKSIALLGQWQPRYLRIADRIEQLLQGIAHTLRWTEEAIGRTDLVAALGSGLGLGLYVGHGRPIGWAGYHGTRRHHFDAFSGEPMGALMSLCCLTASRRRTGLSYAEALPLMGVTAASFGAIEDTLHTDNTRWAVRICDALQSGVETIGDLIIRSAPAAPRTTAAYRLIGDPLAPLHAEASGYALATTIPTYA
jgi:hypothetical protein